jgi:hypothetical protein
MLKDHHGAVTRHPAVRYTHRWLRSLPPGCRRERCDRCQTAVRCPSRTFGRFALPGIHPRRTLRFCPMMQPETTMTVNSELREMRWRALVAACWQALRISSRSLVMKDTMSVKTPACSSALICAARAEMMRHARRFSSATERHPVVVPWVGRASRIQVL